MEEMAKNVLADLSLDQVQESANDAVYFAALDQASGSDLEQWWVWLQGRLVWVTKAQALAQEAAEETVRHQAKILADQQCPEFVRAAVTAAELECFAARQLDLEI